MTTIEKTNLEKDYNKCQAVVLSSRSVEQMTTAVRMCTCFVEKWKNTLNKKQDLLDLLVFSNSLTISRKKRLNVIEDYGFTLEGCRCMTISNENTPVTCGVVVGFEDFGKEHQSFLPLVMYDGDRGICLCMGIVLPENKQLMNELNAMDYKTRWNSVCREHAKIQ